MLRGRNRCSCLVGGSYKGKPDSPQNQRPLTVQGSASSQRWMIRPIGLTGFCGVETVGRRDSEIRQVRSMRLMDLVTDV